MRLQGQMTVMGTAFSDEEQERVGAATQDLFQRLHEAFISVAIEHRLASKGEGMSVLHSACISAIGSMAKQVLEQSHDENVEFLDGVSLAIAREVRKAHDRKPEGR